MSELFEGKMSKEQLDSQPRFVHGRTKGVSICPVPNCFRSATERCKFCGVRYCPDHVVGHWFFERLGMRTLI